MGKIRKETVVKSRGKAYFEERAKNLPEEIDKRIEFVANNALDDMMALMCSLDSDGHPEHIIVGIMKSVLTNINMNVLRCIYRPEYLKDGMVALTQYMIDWFAHEQEKEASNADNKKTD